MPSVWTIRRASISDRMLVTRRPSPMLSVHMAAPADEEVSAKLVGFFGDNAFGCVIALSRPVEASKARGVGAGADGDRLADRVVDHVRYLLGQHVSGVGNMNMLCAADGGAQVGGV
jgi:hypothetical protein